MAKVKKYELEINDAGKLLNGHTQSIATNDQWLNERTFLMAMLWFCYCQYLKRNQALESIESI